MSKKRKSSLIYGGSKALQVLKKRKIDEDMTIQIYEGEEDENKQLQLMGPPRTSKLKTPIVQLKGHNGEVFCCKFSNSGDHFCSGSFDRTVRIWETYGDNSNLIEFTGHKNAIIDVCWSKDDQFVYSAGSDRTVVYWSIEYCKNVRKYRGHKKKVNCVGCAGDNLFFTGSDDSTIKYWDRRTKGKQVTTIDVKYPVFSLDMKDGKYLYCGNITNNIISWDVRNASQPFRILRGHKSGVTSVSISNDSNFLLSFGMDNTLRSWDLRPYIQENRRARKVFRGAVHGIDKNLLRCSWSRNDRNVSCGSSCRNVFVFDSETCRTLYKLPGHRSTVNEVVFHPVEPIILSASSDCTLFLGEIQN